MDGSDLIKEDIINRWLGFHPSSIFEYVVGIESQGECMSGLDFN
jgi:hypothetical protein